MNYLETQGELFANRPQSQTPEKRIALQALNGRRIAVERQLKAARDEFDEERVAALEQELEDIKGQLVMLSGSAQPAGATSTTSSTMPTSPKALADQLKKQLGR